MLFDKFFSLLAVCLGLCGSIFLVKSIIILNPKSMLNLTSPHSYIDYAPEQIKSFAMQKADALSGVLLILIAFFIQICSLIIFDESDRFIHSKLLSIITVIGITLFFAFIFYLLNRHLYKQNRIEICKEAVKYECNSHISNLTDQSNLRSIEHMAVDLLNFTRDDSESKSTYFQRLFNYIGWDIPEEIDLNSINDN